MSTSVSAYDGRGFGPIAYNEGYFDIAAGNYANELASHWSSASTDPYLYGSEFCDASLNGACHDTGTLDLETGDSSFLHTHGGGVGVFLMTYDTSNPGGTGYNTAPTYWELGDTDLEFFETGACQSANYGAAGSVRSLSNGLHQWHGQHGDGGVIFGGAHIADYIDDAFDGNISGAWITNFTSFGYWQSTDEDVCGMSVILGTSTADCNTRRANEEYTNPGLYGDPPSVETAIYHYYCNCDPSGASATPNC